MFLWVKWDELGKSRMIKSNFEVAFLIQRFGFLFSPLFGEMIPIDEHIFQMGWFNHQLVWFFIHKTPFRICNDEHHLFNFWELLKVPAPDSLPFNDYIVVELCSSFFS